MKAIKKIIIGSKAFFNNFVNFNSKDTDYLCIADKFNFNNTNVVNFRMKGDDVFFFRNMTKDQFIEDTLQSGVALRLGKFLVPEFQQYLGLTIEDLKELQPLIDKLDDKHEYEKIIYESYLANGNFTLTEEQLAESYKVYKQYRSN